MQDPSDKEQRVIKIKLLKGEKAIRSYKVRANTFIIGTATGCTMRASGDKSILPKHATIFTDGGELTLVAEPEALVLVNDKPAENICLQPRDIVKIGRLSFRASLAESFDSIELVNRKETTSQDELDNSETSTTTDSEIFGNDYISRGRLSEPPEDTETANHRPSFAHLNGDTGDAGHQDGSDYPAEHKEDLAPSTPGFYMRSITPHPAEAERKYRKDNTDSQWGDNTAARNIQAEKLDEQSYFEEDDETNFTPPFNLVQTLVSKKASVRPGPKEPYLGVHILRVVDGNLLEAATILPGNKFKSQSKDLICKISGTKLVMKCRPGVYGNIWERGRMYELAQVPPKRDVRTCILAEGASANLFGKDGQYKIEIYRPPYAPRQNYWQAVPGFVVLCAMAFFIHTVLGAAAGYYYPILTQAASKVDLSHVNSIEAGILNRTTPNQKSATDRGDLLDNDLIHSGHPGISMATIRTLSAIAKSAKETTSSKAFLHRLSMGETKLEQEDESRVEEIEQKPPEPNSETSLGIKPLLEKMKLSESIDRKVAETLVQSELPAFTKCYQNFVDQGHHFAGEMTFQLSVTSSGRVKQVRAKPSNLDNKMLRSCISAIALNWTLERSGKELATLTLSFQFTPDGEQ